MRKSKNQNYRIKKLRINQNKIVSIKLILTSILLPVTTLRTSNIPPYNIIRLRRRNIKYLKHNLSLLQNIYRPKIIIGNNNQESFCCVSCDDLNIR